MDELAFKRHLRDLAHGHHHPEEHDWDNDASVSGGKTPAAKNTKLPRTPATKRKAANAKRRPASKRAGTR